MHQNHLLAVCLVECATGQIARFTGVRTGGLRRMRRAGPNARKRSLQAGRIASFAARFAYASYAGYRRAPRRRSALLTTDTDDKLIASAAIIGLSNRPKTGYSTPAAIGTPMLL